MVARRTFLFIICAFYVACVECTFFSDQEKEEFVRVHNDKRLLAMSSDMEYMVWDDDLALSASLWSEGCAFEHGKPDVDIPYKKYGQNLYIQSGVSNRKRTEPSSREITEKWYAEISDYTYDTNACKRGEACGHYTQVVWAKSSRVGCGYAACEQVRGLSMRDTWLTTCNYYPQGNFRGRKPYMRGATCSECPDHYSCFNNLCRNCSDTNAPVCASYNNPDHGISLHYQGVVSSWTTLEPEVKDDLTDLVNNFCSKETSTICCPNKSPSSNHTWAPITSFDIYTRSGQDNTSMAEGFDVILVPLLPNVTQVTCNEMYLPNGVLEQATDSTNLKVRWSDDNAQLLTYDFGKNHSTNVTFNSSLLAILLVLISVLNNWKE